MRILILSHEYPPIGGGGGQAAEDIARELAKRGHEITILTAHLKGLPQNEVVEKVSIIRLPSGRKQPYRAGFLEMGMYILAAIRVGLQVIHRWQPDLIHVHFAVPAGAAGWVLTQLSGIPYVLTAHLGDIPGGVPEKTNKWFRWIFPFTIPIWKGAARVVTVSEYTRSLIRQHYPVEPVVIPNGIRIEMEAGPIAVHSPPVIVFAGRFMPQKNLVELVETLARLQDLAWKCILVGDGPLREEVKRTIATHHMDDRFSLPGWVATKEVLSYFTESDLLLLPSLSEGLPLVGLQALAKGLAIVASRAGGNVELVEAGSNGFLADPGDREALTVALRNLLSNHNSLLSARRASRDLANRFNIEIVVDRYETIFREIVSRPATSQNH